MRDWDWTRPHTLNLYEYCANDPVNAWDPDGYFLEELKNWINGKGWVTDQQVAEAQAAMDEQAALPPMEADVTVTVIHGRPKHGHSNTYWSNSRPIFIDGVYQNPDHSRVGSGRYNENFNHYTYNSDGTYTGTMKFPAGAIAMGTPVDFLFGGGFALGFLKGSVRQAVKNACFGQGTLVETKNGKRKIETIKIGDFVLSWDEETGNTSYQIVTNTFRSEKEILLIELTVESKTEKVAVTREHPVQVKGKGWLKAGDLKPLDILVGLVHSEVTNIQPIEGKQTVYNFEVSKYHTYCVGEVGFWAHNRCIPWSSPSIRRAAEALARGSKTVTVKSRSEAEELFLGIFQGQGFKNTTGFSDKGARDFFGGKLGTYHWDDVLDTAGSVMGHGSKNSHASMKHLQIHDSEGNVIRIFFE